jgi:two-component system chemotaxis response regulator CheB
MAKRDIIVVGGSAGSVEAMRELLEGLPKSFPGSIFFVLHLPRESKSLLPEILSRSGFPTRHPQDGERIARGQAYVAPPDRHLLLERDRMRLVNGPRHNRHRPAIDPLFLSAARVFGPRAMGVILSGSLDDGTAGLHEIKRRGGLAFVQDPQTAIASSMPLNAIKYVEIDHSGPVSDLAERIARHVDDTVTDEPPPPDQRLDEQILGHLGMHANMDAIGTPSVFTCPDCHGTLWVAEGDGPARFQCRVGHSFTAEGLLADHEHSLEESLWSALRALEENISLRRHIAERMRRIAENGAADRIEEMANESEEHLAQLRAVLISRSPGRAVDTSDEAR